MGLDVYLYHCEDRPAARAIERAYNEQVEKTWEQHLRGKKYDQATEAEKDAARAACDALAANMGLSDKWGHHHTVTEINKPSAKYPEHLFKVGYFRSSYNSGGINSYFRRLGLPDLNEIMGAGNEYEFTPDWAASKARALDVIGQFKTVECADVDIMAIRHDRFAERLPDSEEAARAVLLEEIKKHTGQSFRSYGCARGDFYLDGIQVLGFMPGTLTLLRKDEPVIYVAYRTEAKDQWYLQALEIVAETCDYVLQQPHPEHHYLTWSA